MSAAAMLQARARAERIAILCSGDDTLHTAILREATPVFVLIAWHERDGGE